jgi:hypothetical protein
LTNRSIMYTFHKTLNIATLKSITSAIYRKADSEDCSAVTLKSDEDFLDSFRV